MELDTHRIISTMGPMTQPATHPSRLSVANIARASAVIDPIFLDTPQFECASLSAQLDCQLVVKFAAPLGSVSAFRPP